MTSTVATEAKPDRRRVLKAGLGAAAASLATPAFAQAYGPGAAPQRYPDPNIVSLDKRFRYGIGNATIMRLHTGTRWAEGPAWNGVGRYLVWSDIASDEQLRYLEEDDHVSRRFRSPSGNSNGNTFDLQGRQISCEHGNRRVVRYEADGKTTILADKFGGKGFNAPNDVVVHPADGSIWFTDPGYGAFSDYEGNRLPEAATSPRPLIKEAIYCIDSQSGALAKVADQPFKPNGLCFSPDYRKLYVADTGTSHYAEAKSQIWVFDVAGAALRNPRAFTSMEMGGKTGSADGVRCDEDGNVWAASGWVGEGYDGVQVFAPDGARIGLIKLPEICANLCFGGAKRNRLFMTASQSLYALYVGTRGAHFC